MAVYTFNDVPAGSLTIGVLVNVYANFTRKLVSGIIDTGCSHTCISEELAEKMKAEGKTDILIMSAGPYKHNSCMSAYCVDAQKMADAAGMLCWTDDGMVRYFSQILFHE